MRLRTSARALMCAIALQAFPGPLPAAPPADAVKSWLVDQAKAGARPEVEIRVGDEPAPARLVSTDGKGVRVQAKGFELTLPWSACGDGEAFYRFAGPAMEKAPADVHAAHLRLGIALGRAGEKAFTAGLVALKLKDAAAAEAVRAEAEKPSGAAPGATPEKPAPGAGSAPPDATNAGGSVADAPEPDPAGGPFRDRYVSGSGKIDRGAFTAECLAADAAAIHRRLGPDFEAFNKGTRRDDPEIHLRHENGEYVWKERGKSAVDWTGMAGQVFYVPARPDNPGVDRMRFCWSFHENHGPSKFWHVYQLKPTMEEWYCKSPDPGVQQAAWIDAAGGKQGLLRPVATARARVEWSNCGIMVFRSGVIGASGYGNNDDKYPCTRLPPGKIPTAVALTPNNEFALVTVWDAGAGKGQLAVVALEARALAHHSWHYAGLPNVGTYTRLKVLGLVDLPVAAPTAVAAAADVAWWKWTTDVSKERLDAQETRDRWLKAADEAHRAASAGYAVVLSRAENKAVFVDLKPLFRYFASMYFTTPDRFDRTKNEGPAPDQWPFTFDKAPEARPRVAQVLPVPRPTAVATGFAGGRSRDYADRCFIATMDGRLIVCDTGSLNASAGSKDDAAQKSVVPVGAVPIGRNPTCIYNGRHGGYDRDDLVICCRGDREVVWVTPSGKGGTVTRRLRDKRLQDPAWIEVSDTRGAAVVTVADFKGAKLVNYLYKPIDSWGERLFGGLGPDGKAEFECTGVMEVPGTPFFLSSAEVN